MNHLAVKNSLQVYAAEKYSTHALACMGNEKIDKISTIIPNSNLNVQLLVFAEYQKHKRLVYVTSVWFY